MNHCINHPGREGKFTCMKYRKNLCDECMACQDPGLYCRYRSQCVIWELSRYGENRLDSSSNETETVAEEAV